MESTLTVKTTHKIDLPCGYDLNSFLIKKSDLHNANDHSSINGIQ